ncbi:MAG: hypothetical protein ACOH18_05020 [Candidatus Saccharimonadaceae bacterium]
MATNQKVVKVVTESGPLGWLAFSAYLGAVVYFFSIDLTFWGFILALIKAAFWPAFIVFEVLGALGVR